MHGFIANLFHLDNNQRIGTWAGVRPRLDLEEYRITPQPKVIVLACKVKS
jgi:hypothetical protein